MPGSSSWMPYAPQGVKGFDDNSFPDIIVLVSIPPSRVWQNYTAYRHSNEITINQKTVIL